MSIKWGWALMVLWIGYWIWHLNVAKTAAFAEPCPDSLGNKIGDFFSGEGQTCRNNIDAQFGWQLFGAIVISPICFWPAHYLAKFLMEQEKAQEGFVAEAQRRKQLAEEQKRQREHAAAIDDLSKRTQIEHQSARASGERYEIITRLGAVDDQLVVLDKEKNPESIKLIKLNIGQSIRDIHAKFRDEELRTMYAGDEGVRQRVERTLAEMRRLRMAKSRFYADLSGMFHQPLNERGKDAVIVG